MNVREKMHELFNVQNIAAGSATEDVQFMLFGNGYVAGMNAAAEILKAEWFKTQQECVEAIEKAARKL